MDGDPDHYSDAAMSVIGPLSRPSGFLPIALSAAAPVFLLGF